MPTTQEQIDAVLARNSSPAQGGWGYDAQRRTWFSTDTRGRRRYENTDMGIPESVAGTGRTVADGMIRPTADRNGGGVLHDNARWSQDRGEFYSPFSFDKLATYATIGALTGGVANAAMAGSTLPAAVPAAGLTPGAGLPALPTVSGAFGAGGVTAGTAGSTVMPAATAGLGGRIATQAVGPAIGAASSLYGGKQQGRANQRADTQTREAALRAEAAQAVRDAEDRRRWDVDQANQVTVRTAADEQRAFERAQSERIEADRVAQRVIEARDRQLAEEDRARRQQTEDRQRRLDDERETRRAPYRAASAAALGRLGGLLGGGQNTWRSPSNAGRAGTLGSMVGR